ncbi:hypothetical protein PR048_018563 [Dryococelus australis]|uniref:F-box domain-containing protein n=1 Tax=Dryococelus australis TaxID=614101 RepID=A0ABQ9HCK6_9NEOP|nr:hypothetical protein PR048_018563 [Dryococelus australis]
MRLCSEEEDMWTGGGGGGIECLPDEMLGRIFSQLPVEVRGLLFPVSQQFQSVADTPYYWCYLGVEGGRGSTQQVCRVLSRAHFLRRLVIENREDANELLACVARHARSLTSLRVCGRLRRLVSLGHQLRGRNVVQEIGSRRRCVFLRRATAQVSLKHEDAYVATKFGN